MGLADAATRKVGPLPAWGWGAVVVGGYIAYRFVRGGSDGTTAAGIPVDMTAGYGGGGGGGGGGGSLEDRLADAIDKLSEAVGKLPVPGGTGGGGSGGGTGGGGTTTPGSGSGSGSGSGVATSIGDAIARNPFNLPGFAAANPDAVSYSDPIVGAGTWSGYQDRLLELIEANPTAPVLDTIQQAAREFDMPYTPPSGGPETVLTNQQYADLVLGGWAGKTGQALILSSPNVGMNTVDPATGLSGYQSWYNYLLNVGPEGYIAPNIGTPTTEYERQLTVQEYWRNLAIAKENAEANMAISTGMPGAASGSPPTITNQPLGSSPVTPAPSTSAAPVDYSAAIATLEGYIRNLRTGTVTQADRDKIALYEARIQEYAAR